MSEQVLILADRLYPAVTSGGKTHTIRWRETRIVPGPMTYRCEKDPSRTATVWVTRCTDMVLSKAAGFLGKADEWPDAVMLCGMREHYPDIDLTDTVQVIEHLSPDESASRLASA